MQVLTPSRPKKPRPARDGARDPNERASGRWLDDPEVRLMLQVQGGDQGAFAELERRYGARVLGYFYRQLGDRTEAEDLTQEVFLRLYRSRQRYQPRARFATWVFHITQNVARNAVRSRRRHPCVRLDTTGSEEGGLLDVLLSDSGDAPSRPVERDELAGVVRAAVAGLAGRQRAALELYQFGDRTYAEVAAELAMTPKAAKSLLYRARNQLRITLTPFMS